MRKIYYLFLTMLFGMVGMTANAASDITVNFNVDNPDNVRISVDGVYKTLVAGDNQIVLSAPYGYYSSVYVNATDGNFITKVTKDGSNQLYNAYNSYWSFYPSEGDDGKTITIETAKGDDVRTASCKVTVDDASKVRVQRSGSYTTVNLKNGENTVNYIPGYETMLMISSTSYGTPLYKATLNGDELTYSNGYSANLNPGQVDEIDIKANFPEGLKYNVTLTYVNKDKAKGVVTGVTVDGTAIDNYDTAGGFEVPAGKAVALTFDNVNYKIDGVTLNGTSVTVYSSYNFTPTDKTVINIDAHKYGTVKANLNIDNKDNVTVYKGYSYNNDVIDVVNGNNDIELPENNAIISIKPNSGCYITSVTYGETTLSNQGEYTIYNITEGMEISVVSGAIVRDKSFTFNIDDVSAAQYGATLSRSDRSSVEIATGPNTVDFADNETSYSFNAYGSPVFGVFKGGVMLPLPYTGATYVDFTVADGDVFDAFLKALPSTYKVAFTAASDVHTYYITVSTDAAGVNNKWQTDGITAIEGTEFTVTLSSSESINVKVDGTYVPANTEGKYVFTVNKATAVEILDPTTDGINSINAAANDGKIYNLQGVEVKKMSRGMYIKNGKKVVVK
ncbi:MAG: hypothetical protein SOZ58_07845 [Prevotella sp.]|nr:hypothetical protein [Prevotella sp.]